MARAQKGTISPSKYTSSTFLRKVMRSKHTSHTASGGVKDYDPGETRALYNEKTTRQAEKADRDFARAVRQGVRGNRARKNLFPKHEYRKGNLSFFFSKKGYKKYKSGADGRWVTIKGRRVFLVAQSSNIPF